MTDIEEIKKKIYQIAAITDRGQRLNKLIAPMYQDKSNILIIFQVKIYGKKQKV